MNTSINPIGILPLGDVPVLALKIVSANISAYLRLNAEILPSRKLPEIAFNEIKAQYDAALILKALEAEPLEKYDRIVGILKADLFVPVFTHVYGEARQGGYAAVVSLFRLNRNPDGSVPDTQHFYERAAKVALHEIGHLFGLSHCREKKCLMHFSDDMAALDSIPPYLCRECSAGFFCS